MPVDPQTAERLLDELLDAHSVYQHAYDAELKDARWKYKETRAAVLAAMTGPQWQTIDSAPKDDTFYFIWDGEVRALVSWTKDHWYGVDELGLRYDSRTYARPGPQPTHWMPLAAAPEAPR